MPSQNSLRCFNLRLNSSFCVHQASDCPTRALSSRGKNGRYFKLHKGGPHTSSFLNVRSMDLTVFPFVTILESCRYCNLLQSLSARAWNTKHIFRSPLSSSAVPLSLLCFYCSSESNVRQNARRNCRSLGWQDTVSSVTSSTLGAVTCTKTLSGVIGDMVWSPQRFRRKQP